MGMRAEKVAGGDGTDAHGLGWGRALGEVSLSSRSVGAAEATYAAATFGGGDTLSGALGATSLGIGLVAAYDRRQLESRERGNKAERAGNETEGFAGGLARARRPTELGGTFKTGIASIAESGSADSGGSGVREVMAAPILSPSSAATGSPISSGYAQQAAGSSSTLLPPSGGSGGGVGEVHSIGRGGRGAGAGRGVAPPAPAFGAPVHPRPPSVASRAHASPHPGATSSHVLGSLVGENAGGMNASHIVRLPSAGRASGRGSRMGQNTPAPGIAPPLPPGMGVGGSGALADREEDPTEQGYEDSVRSEFGGLWKPLGKSEVDHPSGSDRFGM